MRATTKRGLVLLTLALMLSPVTAHAQEASVSAIDNEFDPAQLDVDEGTTVTWTNNGEAPHTVTASDGSFESGNLDPGQTFSYTFDEAGEFSYVCDYHESTGMVGSVTVAAAGNGGNGGGNGNGTDDPTDEPTDTTGDDTTGDDELPQTGPDGLGAFLYLAAVLIGAGAFLIWFDRPQTGSGTQSRVR